MPGTKATVLSEIMLKNNTQSALTKALDDANNFVKKLDIKKTKKSK
jgi:hypothetical protein